MFSRSFKAQDAPAATEERIICIVDSYAHLMLGTSLHGPVVTPGNGEGSVIIKKLRGTAGFGGRMPLRAARISPMSTINKISLWITQGAQDN